MLNVLAKLMRKKQTGVQSFGILGIETGKPIERRIIKTGDIEKCENTKELLDLYKRWFIITESGPFVVELFVEGAQFFKHLLLLFEVVN